MKLAVSYLLYFAISIQIICSQTDKSSSIFKQIDSNHSNIQFENKIIETLDFNYYLFMHMYMGAGVATGDFNNDGLADIYFTSNLEENKLYLNKGELQFEDITEKSNTQGEGGFHTGVTTVDINNDGFLDIYVCSSGPEDDFIQRNLLYINNGDLTFTESAVNYGLSEYNTHSIQSNFFDYDNDGDLDVYIVNTPVKFSLANEIINTEEIYNDPKYKEFGGADKLYRNNGDLTFTNVSEESGIKADIFFGLNALIGDINNDGWKDIFVSNDFNGPDFCYINNGNGTFSEKATDVFSHISNYSMGADMADVNNDGLLDLFVLDMLPEDYKRSKTSMAMMPRDVMSDMISSGYHRQYMHNVLQINNGNTTNIKPLFNEVSYFSGVENTDWSWSCLLADFDLDGHNDLHVTNGILRDVTNVDSRVNEKAYFNQLKESKSLGLDNDILSKSRELFPSVKLSNYLFLNNGDLTFKDVSTQENVGNPSFSNGSAIADFDNDGDLDLVTNNLNDKAFLFENTSKNKQNHYLKIKLNGSAKNKFGIGARIKIKYNDQIQVKELSTTRGYFSASEPIIHFGLDKTKKIDQLEVIWPDGSSQTIQNIKADQLLTLKHKNTNAQHDWAKNNSTEVAPIFKSVENLLSESFIHKDLPYDDFKNQLLLPHKLSATGPTIAKGDLNNDGLEDFFIGGATWFSGAVYLQNSDGLFQLSNQKDLEKDNKSEDVGSLLFDADNDGDLDLYVISGSYEFPNGADQLEDRLYLNDGNAKLTRSINALPAIKQNSSCVVAIDYDLDGDKDLFIGGRVDQGNYPYPANSFLLQNNKGVFTNITSLNAPILSNIGMVTSAISSDFDNDNDEDLVLVGEWMPITFLRNDHGTFKNVTSEKGMDKTIGWWNTIIEVDINNDKTPDYIAGNLGLNYKFHASKEKPFHVFGNDFDNTGTIDIVLAKDIDNHLFPVRGKMCSSEQMPFIKEKFPTFTEFANADLQNIYGTTLKEALHIEAQEFQSSFVLSGINKTHKLIPLPLKAQLSPINGIIYDDFNKDGFSDILLAGNMFDAEVETSRADAGNGLLLLGKGKSKFEALNSRESGFFVPGNIKALESINTVKGHLILVGENNALLKIFSVSNSEL
jgi:hypothetical protein